VKKINLSYKYKDKITNEWIYVPRNRCIFLKEFTMIPGYSVENTKEKNEDLYEDYLHSL
jgi:hypothetical protein